MTQGWRMQRRLFLAKPTTGGTGVQHGAETAFTFGVTLRPLSCPMGLTAGSASSWMANWQPCIPQAALKGAQKAQVRQRDGHNYCLFVYWCLLLCHVCVHLVLLTCRGQFLGKPRIMRIHVKLTFISINCIGVCTRTPQMLTTITTCFIVVTALMCYYKQQ